MWVMEEDVCEEEEDNCITMKDILQWSFRIISIINKTCMKCE